MPLLPVVLVALLTTVDWVVATLSPSGARSAGLVVPVACVLVAILPPSHVAQAYDQTSALIRGVSSPLSPALQTVRRLRPGAPIATNTPSTVYGRAGRACLMVPLRRIAVTGRTNPEYEPEIAQMARLLIRNHGYLVLAAGGFGASTAAGASEFAKWSRLVPLALTPSLSVYRIDAP